MRPNPFDGLLSRSELQRDPHSRMRLLELGNDVRQQIGPGHPRSGNPQRSRAAHAEFSRAEGRLHQQGFGTQHVVPHKFAGTRQCTVTPCTFDEPQSQRMLQVRNMFRHGRLADVQLGRGRCKRSTPGKRGKRSQPGFEEHNFKLYQYDQYVFCPRGAGA